MKDLIQHYQKQYCATVTALNLVRYFFIYSSEIARTKSHMASFGPGLLRDVSATGQLLQNINLRQNIQFGIHVLGHKLYMSALLE